MLPQSLKNQLGPYFDQTEKKLLEIQGIYYHTTILAREKAAYGLVQDLIDKISSVLHEQAEGGEKQNE